MTEQDRALEAFHRLLADASVGGQAKVDALMALAQRTVLVPVWSDSNQAFRTLVNPQGDTALPVFTSRALLRAAGTRFGWVQPDGTVPHREVGSRLALRHALAHNLPYVVVDIASPHSLEVTYGEMGPLLTPEARRESSGPFAGVGRLSSSMLEAVKATPAPGDLERPPTPDRGSPRPASPRPQRRQTMPQGRTPTPATGTPSPAPATRPAPAPSPPALRSGPGPQEPDDLSQTGTRPRPQQSTPLAHVLGERERRTPSQGKRRKGGSGHAKRESAQPPPMDATGAYGAAAKAARRQLDGRTPPAGGIRTPFVQRSSAPPERASFSPSERPASAPPSRRDSGLHSDVPRGMGAAPGSIRPDQPARISPLGQEPPETLLDAATAILRDYPEVEWASFCFAARGDGGPMPALALRVDDGFRQRVGEIVLGLRTASAQEGSDVDVVLLDDPETTRLARSDGVVFYPWRRSPSKPGT